MAMRKHINRNYARDEMIELLFESRCSNPGYDEVEGIERAVAKGMPLKLALTLAADENGISDRDRESFQTRANEGFGILLELRGCSDHDLRAMLAGQARTLPAAKPNNS